MRTRKDRQHWTTKDGRVLLVSEMEDRHLVNTIRMLRRNVEAYRLAHLSQMWRYMESAPDGAYDACDDAARQTEQMSTEEFLKMVKPCYATMLAEAEVRGLVIQSVSPRDVERAALGAFLTAMRRETVH